MEAVNPAAEQIFDYKATELLGRNVSMLMPSPDREQHDSYLSNYLRTGHAKIIGIGREVVGMRKDGTTFPMDLAVSEVRLPERKLFTGFVRDITERKRLGQEILAISNREQRRIGQDLHDGLCQELAGIQLMAEVLEQDLKSKRDSAQAAKIAESVRRAISHTRMLARGLSPVEVENNGLMSALHELAQSTAALFHIACSFKCPTPVLVRDNAAATHLYRIAQEAINNAVKHGRARKVVIRLAVEGKIVRLRVEDDGTGFKEPPAGHHGMGLHIMKYRSEVVGAKLTVTPGPKRGTVVTCEFQSGL